MTQTAITGNRNPYLPLSIYIPDGEPKLFGGRVYLYGSKDEFGGAYCSHRYHAYSAPVDRLEEWTDHGPIFASDDSCLDEGVADGVPWSSELLYAPDVVEKDGKYYLYFCLSDGSEGVAESEHPYGPFGNAQRITMNGQPIVGIDPSVLKDNGSYYYTWGQFKCHLAKLNDDMCTLDASTYVDALISNEDEMQGFHEGSSLRKIGDWYTLVYASEYTLRYPNHGGRPTCLDYAVSKRVEGPYERRGTIIDNTGVDPQTWNNHGSILKIQDQWYVFYHGSSNNTQYNRRARAERITVDEANGWIRTAVITSNGFGDGLNPKDKLSAAYGYRVWGGAYFTEKENNYPLVNVVHGTAVAYRFYQFGEGGKWKIILCGSFLNPGEVSVIANGEVKARLRICGTENEWIESTPMELRGKMDIKLAFSAAHDKEILELDSIQFECM